MAKIDGAPAPKRLVLFSRQGYAGTAGGLLLGQGDWSDVSILPDGCVPDGKCQTIAHGRVWIDPWKNEGKPPKTLSGKYQVFLDGRHLEGRFDVKRRYGRKLVRLCE